MAALAARIEAPQVSIGRVFERAFLAVRRNPGVTIGLVFLFGAFPGVALQLLVSSIDPTVLVMTVAGYALPGIIALFLLQWFVSQVIGSVVQGAVVGPMLAQDQGRRASFGESLAAAMRSFVPLVGFGMLLGIGVEIGMTLLIVPGILIYLMWCVAPSALAAEREGMFMALNRSQELTEGSRWKIFAILLVLETASFVLSAAVAFLASRLLGINLSVPRLGFGDVIILGLLSIAVNLTWATVQASLYVELTRSKEGDSVENLVEVFA